MGCRRSLLTSTALLFAWASVSALPAHAMSDAEKIERLERQTELLQQQLKELKGEIARTRKKADSVEAVQTRLTTAPVADKGPIFKAPSITDKIKLTMGGFIAAESVWRQRNEVADIGSNFGGIPYPFSPAYNEHEFHGTARQSRISLLAEGMLDARQKLSGYFEVDFLGAGTTSNFNQSNSWAPRLRHAYVTYDNTDWGWHFLAGQSWSLLTQTTTGIVPRKENIPLTVDASYLPGFNYTRNWQLRAVKDFGSVSLGVSVENPAAIFGGSTATAPAGTGGAFASGGIVDGTVVNFSNPGSSFLTTTTVTADQLPDIIEKAAFDTGWGHYEAFGLQRFFSSNTLSCLPGPCIAGSTVQTGNVAAKSAFGWGVGGSAFVPIVPKYLEFTGNVLYGQGIGRYGAGQLPDVTIARDGSLTPLTGLTAMVGLIGHPWEGLDVYAYAGMEQVDAKFFDAGTALFGYGNPGFSNVGCTVATPSSFSGATPANCIANNKRLSELTVGFWQNLYKGDYGRVALGGQYAYIRRESFTGVGGTVSTDDNMILTSLRYYPF